MIVPTEHLVRLAARPRPTGGPAVAEARDYCAGVLSSLGFAVVPKPFEYSAFPGALGTPLGGAWLAGAVSAAAWAALRNDVVTAGTLLVAGVLILAMVGRYLATRGVLDLPLMRRGGVNLEATRGTAGSEGSDPKVWLVAHVDSKWQPIPMAARAGGIVLLGLASTAALVVSILQWRLGRPPETAWTAVLIAAWIGAVPVLLSVAGGRGPGAVDNASGVAAVLAAAALLPRDASVGVLVTDAEELGLAGARAWARGRAAGVALNCDGVDDDGRLTMMYSGPMPARVATALHTAVAREASQAPLRVIRVIPGVLTDSVALASAGWETATLSRGSLRTLRRIHTTSDSLATMRGTSIAFAGRILAGAATELC